MNKQKAVVEFMHKAGQEVPMFATEPALDVRRLRVRLIAEELLELARASGIDMRIQMHTPGEGDAESLANLDMKKPNSSYAAIVDAADALGDLLVVVYGGGAAWGIALDPVFEEIHRSNMTKFIDGYRRPDGKWVKGPSYTPADISSVIDNQRSFS